MAAQKSRPADVATASMEGQTSAALPSPFPPIAEYAFLSNCHTGALVAPDGAVDWLCVPRFDSPSVFGSLLDRGAGSFRLGPFGINHPSAVVYEPGTNILLTTWKTPTGWIMVRDALTMGPRHGEDRITPHTRPPADDDGDHMLVRTVLCLDGRVEVERFDTGEALRVAVQRGTVNAGVLLPDGYGRQVREGGQAQVAFLSRTGDPGGVELGVWVRSVVRQESALLQAARTGEQAAGMSFEDGLRAGDDGSHSAEEVTSLTREAGFGAEVKRRIMLGTYALSSGYYDAYYGSSQKVRTLIKRDFDKAFEQVDVIVSPTTPTTAFPIGERADDPMAMYLADLCTIPTNLAGNAAMSLPCGLAPEDNLPVGLQIMAPVMKDDRLYKVGAAVEAAFVEKWGHPLLEEAPSL